VIDVIPVNGETWCICGGRDFADQPMFDGAMGDIIRLKGMPSRIVHGNCRTGADQMADKWALHHGLERTAVDADWNAHGKAAGPIRNQEMIDLFQPKRLVAFPGGRGTADMVRRARVAEIEVIEVKHMTRSADVPETDGRE
jgi:hypothetical protein